jgi:hypothetical protein
MVQVPLYHFWSPEDETFLQQLFVYLKKRIEKQETKNLPVSSLLVDEVMGVTPEERKRREIQQEIQQREENLPIWQCTVFKCSAREKLHVSAALCRVKKLLAPLNWTLQKDLKGNLHLHMQSILPIVGQQSRSSENQAHCLSSVCARQVDS